MDQSHIRNFCIIAHIDHGKSTLADRMIEMTGALRREEMSEQVLDSMDLEKERGITIKAKAIRLKYKADDGEEYMLNLIDTPGHVDFSYEVSRTLVACEGAILLVDATQGIQAQTLANVYLAMDNDLEIIPALNKIDMVTAEVDRVMGEVESVRGYKKDETYKVSGKTGEGVHELMEAIVKQIPPPHGNPDAPARGLIFDSHYDKYKGVVAYTRVVDGSIKRGDKIKLMAQGTEVEVLDAGYFGPRETPVDGLDCGEVGYIATGLKQVGDCPVGDTITNKLEPAAEALSKYTPAKPMVFAGIFPTSVSDYQDLRDAIEKLKLNDAALTFEMENSPLMGHGFRCGFLGLLHMDIVYERLEREFGLELVITAPGVSYQITKNTGEIIMVNNPSEFPDPSEITSIQEPWVNVHIITPAAYIGTVMEMERNSGGIHRHTEYIGIAMGEDKSHQRVQLDYDMPLREIITDFYDRLKSRTRGYASLDYELEGYRETKLVRLDVLVNGEMVDAFSRIVPPEKATALGRYLVHKLRGVIPRHLFTVPIQACVGGRILAREDIAARRKDVLAKCYGGDITRKRKLLEKQKEGKKKMKTIGKVEVPKEAFLSVLTTDDEDK